MFNFYLYVPFGNKNADVSADDRSPVSETHRWKGSSFCGGQKTVLYQRGWGVEVRALSRHKLNFSMSNAL